MKTPIMGGLPPHLLPWGTNYLLYCPQYIMMVAQHYCMDEQNSMPRTIGGKEVVPWRTYKGRNKITEQPHAFRPQRTTVWSFQERGNWASHTPQYRGNWSPWVVRNLITLYSTPGDIVLDPMVGGGTTPVECRLLGRNSISIDINPDAIAITKDRMDLPMEIVKELPNTTHELFVGDTRNLSMIEDQSVDLILAHPPYANIIRYTTNNENDLSCLNTVHLFFKEYKKAIGEYKRVLKSGKYCAILMGDTHRRGHCVPLSSCMLINFLKEGFILKEKIVKKEWNCQSDNYSDKYSNMDFLLTMHEDLLVFRKPDNFSEAPSDSSISVFCL